MTEPTKSSEPLHARVKGLSTLPTSEITLPLELVAQLHDIAPKPRRSRVTWAIALALLSVVASIGASRTMRERVAARLGFGAHPQANQDGMPSAPAPSTSVATPAAAASVPTFTRPSAPAASSASAAPSTAVSASGAPPEKKVPEPRTRPLKP